MRAGGKSPALIRLGTRYCTNSMIAGGATIILKATESVYVAQPAGWSGLALFLHSELLKAVLDTDPIFQPILATAEKPKEQ